MFIPFSPPDITEYEIEEVAKVMRSGWITTGPKTKELEKRLAQYLKVNRCVCLNSQTACAELTLRILGVGQGDEVITTAYTYTASASVACHVGATLKLIDIAKNGMEMDYDALEQAITERTKVIIPVDIAGVPCDYNRIFEIVEKKRSLFKANSDIQKAFGRIIVLADTAHALGAQYKGKMVGSVADFSAFSFHAVKNFTTAEGGAVTWNSIKGIDDEVIYQKYQLMSLHGQSKDALSKAKKGEWEYDVIEPSYKCNMTDIAAAMGLAQLDRYEGMLSRRREIADRYDKAFKNLGIEVLNHENGDSKSCCHLYITRVPGINADQRNEIIEKMAKAGVCCNVHYKPLPMLTAYKELGFDIKNYPNAYKYFENEITLPLHTLLTDEQVEFVIGKYSAIVKEYIK